jgi:SAM-dependent methyltransferase
MRDDARLYAPSAARNRDPIRAVLLHNLPESGLVLEIASGSGEHVCHVAAACGPDLIFQPSDVDASARASVDAWARSLELKNVRPAIVLDATAETWPVAAADVVIAINMIHIAPWTAVKGLVKNAGRILPPGGLLFLYGPFRIAGADTVPSNAAFDADLRRRNSEWGVRDLEAVAALAEAQGFAPPEVIEMPANNLSVIFGKRAA